jgi:hypothetical protein
MERVLSAESAIFIKLKLIRGCALIFSCGVISSFAFRACQGNDYSHFQSPLPLFDDFTDHSGTHRTSAFADRKANFLLHRNRRDQLRLDGHIVPGHHHLHPLG